MFIRAFAFLLCQATILACTITFYDLPGWANMPTDFRIIIGTIGGVAALMLLMLVMVSEERIARLNYAHQARNRRRSIGHPLR
jgi:hypothetical protein